MNSKPITGSSKLGVAARTSAIQLARNIVEQNRQINATQLISMLRTVPSAVVILADNVSDANNIVDEATYYATIVMAALPDTTASELVIALKDTSCFPELTSLQMGQVLKANGVFPLITAQQMQTALLAANYSQEDALATIRQLFPKPVSYRRLGPIGIAGQMPFDDNIPATSGQVLTQLNVRHGNIIDGIQAWYGNPPVASPLHGGMGGEPTSISLTNELIAEISGFTGYWFGANYILQLIIKTQGHVYGPFGNMVYADSRSPFLFRVEPNENIVGFFGSATYGNNGQAIYLGSLGLIVKTN